MTELVLHPLEVVTIGEQDIAQLYRFQRRKIMPVPVDIVVLHPNLPEGLRDHHRSKIEYPILVGLHATLGEVHYICRIAMLSDEQILSVASGPYSAHQVDNWLYLGGEIPPYKVTQGKLAFAGTQLEIAGKSNEVRTISR